MNASRSAVAVVLALLATVVTWPALGLARGEGPAGAAAAPPERVSPAHFELDRSVPAADTTVAPTDRVQLWFTQEPQEGTTRIRVMEGDLRVPTGDAVAAEEDPTSYLVVSDMPLSPGDYRVMWRSMAADGHVVDGEFGFTVVETPGVDR